MPRGKKDTFDTEKLPGWIDDPAKITKDEIRRYSILKGVRNTLNKQHPNGWGDDEVRQYIIEQRQKKLEEARDQLDLSDQEEREVESELEVRVRSYLAIFPSPTPNDKSKITELCRLEMTLDELARRENLALKKREDPKTYSDLESLAKTRRDLLAAYSKLETELGIDRAKRHQESDAVSLYEKTKRQASVLLAQRSRPILCPECGKADIQVNYGLVLFSMDQNNVPWSLEFECPRCKNRVTIGNPAWTRSSTLTTAT